MPPSMDQGLDGWVLSLETPFVSLSFWTKLGTQRAGGTKHLAAWPRRLRGHDSELVEQAGGWRECLDRLQIETHKWRPLVLVVVSSLSFREVIPSLVKLLTSIWGFCLWFESSTPMLEL